MNDQDDNFSFFGYQNSFIPSTRNPFPEGQICQLPPTGRQMPGSITPRTQQDIQFEKDTTNEVSSENDSIHINIGNKCLEHQKYFQDENGRPSNLCRYLDEIETADNETGGGNSQLLSLTALENLTLEKIKKIDRYLSIEDKHLTQINTKYLLPQLKKEYRDLSFLVLKAQNYVDDIRETLDHKIVNKSIQNTLSGTNVSEIHSLSDCKQSLISCLKCLIHIKSFLKKIYTENKNNLLNSSGTNPSISTLVSEKERFIQQSHTSISTPLPNCPCCGSTSNYQNSNFSYPYMATNESPSSHGERVFPIKNPLNDDHFIIIYKHDNSKFVHSSVTNTVDHIPNAKIRSHYVHEDVKRKSNQAKMTTPLTIHHRPHNSEGSLGFKRCTAISKNKRGTQSLHTTNGITCISIYEDTTTNDQVFPVNQQFLDDRKEKNLQESNIYSNDNLERRESLTTVDITITSDIDTGEFFKN